MTLSTRQHKVKNISSIKNSIGKIRDREIPISHKEGLYGIIVKTVLNFNLVISQYHKLRKVPTVL